MFCFLFTSLIFAVGQILLYSCLSSFLVFRQRNRWLFILRAVGEIIVSHDTGWPRAIRMCAICLDSKSSLLELKRTWSRLVEPARTLNHSIFIRYQLISLFQIQKCLTVFFLSPFFSSLTSFEFQNSYLKYLTNRKKLKKKKYWFLQN